MKTSSSGARLITERQAVFYDKNRGAGGACKRCVVRFLQFLLEVSWAAFRAWEDATKDFGEIMRKYKGATVCGRMMLAAFSLLEEEKK